MFLSLLYLTQRVPLLLLKLYMKCWLEDHGVQRWHNFQWKEDTGQLSKHYCYRFAFCHLASWYPCVLHPWHPERLHCRLSSQAAGWRALPKKAVVKQEDSGRSGERRSVSPCCCRRLPAVVREGQAGKLKSPGCCLVQPWGWGSLTPPLRTGKGYLCVCMGDGINQCMKAEGMWWLFQ